MVIYSHNGFKCTYPKGLKKKSNFPAFMLINSKTKDLLTISPEPSEWKFNYSLSIRMPNQAHSDPNIEVLRKGECSRYPGSQEILYKQLIVLPTGEIISCYCWTILIPLDGRIININVKSNKESDIDEIWAPIVNSFEFDASQFEGGVKKSTELIIKKYNWVRTSLFNKSKHFKHVFHPVNATVAIYDFGIEYLPDNGLDDDFVSRRIFKKHRAAALAFSDALNVTVDLYCNEDPPDEYKSKEAWEHIVEGMIGIDSGKMYVNAMGQPEVEVQMKKGCYIFRAYFGPLNTKNDSQNCQIYFWETDQLETNEVKILKQGPS